MREKGRRESIKDGCRAFLDFEIVMVPGSQSFCRQERGTVNQNIENKIQ